jgi:hypothetical protein
VQGTQFEQGKLMIPADARSVFKNTGKIYIKELSPLSLASPAQSLLTDGGDIIFGVSKYGKGHLCSLWAIRGFIMNMLTAGGSIPASRILKRARTSPVGC